MPDPVALSVTRPTVRILHLYRPRLPGPRAQAIQVVHTCHALACAGATVTLLADRNADAPPDPARALAWYGLDPVPGLDLRVAPVAWAPGASAWFRTSVALWRGELVYARAKRYVSLAPRSARVVLEAHEVDSLLAEERGHDPGPARALERAALSRAAGVTANARGTLELLRAAHRIDVPTRVIHNATSPSRVVARAPAPTPVVGWTGSPRAYKGLATVVASLSRWPAEARLELVGGTIELPAAVAGRVDALPPVPYAALPARLARYHALLLPLDDDLFGRHLSNPLKLWDYLATGIPIVAPELPSVREVAGDTPHYYRPGDPEALAAAVGRALAAGSAPRRVRTWADRAREILEFCEGLA